MKSPEELSEIIEQMSELCIRNKCTYPEMIRLVFPFLAWRHGVLRNHHSKNFITNHKGEAK